MAEGRLQVTEVPPLPLQEVWRWSRSESTAQAWFALFTAGQRPGLPRLPWLGNLPDPLSTPSTLP